MNAVLVVEGKADESFIRSFLDVEVVTTNGSEISRETITLLQSLAAKKRIIVLTDPDSPGERIRSIIRQAVPEALHAFIPKEKAIKRHKVGVAESDKDTVLEALANLIPNVVARESDVTVGDLCEFGLLGSENAAAARRRLSRRWHLGKANGKTILRRLRALGITRRELEEALNDD